MINNTEVEVVVEILKLANCLYAERKELRPHPPKMIIRQNVNQTRRIERYKSRQGIVLERSFKYISLAFNPFCFARLQRDKILLSGRHP